MTHGPADATALRLLRGADLPPLAWASNGNPFELARVQPVRIHRWRTHKPSGGLWTAPVLDDGDTAWTQWCRCEQFGDPDAPRTVIVPHSDAVVYCIDAEADLLALEAAYPLAAELGDNVRLWPRLDWEKMATETDAVWLTRRGEHETRYTTPGLYGWDCATVLWLRPAFTAVEDPKGRQS